MAELVAPDNSCRLDVRFFAPPDDLAACFTTIYRLETFVEDGGTVADYLQPEWSNLRFFCGGEPQAQVCDRRGASAPRVDGARFQATGPTSRPIRFELGSTRMWGVGLKPLGWARYVGYPANEAVNYICDGETDPVFAQFAPLCDFLCASDRTAADQNAELVAFFRAHPGTTRDESRILAIHEAMLDPYLVQIEDFSRAARMHKRTLERLCLKHFGFSPRGLLRRQRMMRSLTAFMLGEGRSWSETIDRHYHDQSHFVREFHSFMGMSPSEYAALPHPILGAFVAERQRIWGSPAQTLDQPQGMRKQEREA